MDNKKKNHISTKMLLYICSLICVILIVVTFLTDRFTTPVRNALSYIIVPMQTGVNNMGLWAYDRSEELKDINKLIDENKKLKDEIAELTERNKQLELDGYELSRLRDLYKLDAKYEGYDKVGARIIARDNSNWFNKFTVDKGSNDGICVGMNVIADGGLVGIVSDVTDNTSTIRTIIDDQSVVSGMLIDSGDTCTVSGSLKLINSGILEVNNFKSTAVVKEGDAIVTSNISSMFLEGILIGYMKDISTDNNELTKSGHIIPVVDFEHMQEVLIITKMKE